MVARAENPGQFKKLESQEDRRRLRVDRSGDDLRVDLGDTLITVVTAKKPGQPWKDKDRATIEVARASYRTMWGDVSLWDSADRRKTTYNYVSYVEYRTRDGDSSYTEALSNRMVLEDPDDIAFYHVNSTPLAEALRDVGINPQTVAGESRIGAQRPAHAKSNMRTLEAFAAIKLQMVADARTQGIKYIACQLRADLPSLVFSMDGTNGHIRYDFPPTEDVLGLPKGTLKLNRDDPVVAHHILHFPGYFLDTKSVNQVILELFHQGAFSIDTFREMTGLDTFTDLQHARNIKALLPLIHGGNRLAVMLQNKLLNEVPDGTYSSISHVDDIERRAIKTLSNILSLPRRAPRILEQ